MWHGEEGPWKRTEPAHRVSAEEGKMEDEASQVFRGGSALCFYQSVISTQKSTSPRVLRELEPDHCGHGGHPSPLPFPRGDEEQAGLREELHGTQVLKCLRRMSEMQVGGSVSARTCIPSTLGG